MEPADLLVPVTLTDDEWQALVNGDQGALRKVQIMAMAALVPRRQSAAGQKRSFVLPPALWEGVIDGDARAINLLCLLIRASLENRNYVRMPSGETWSRPSAFGQDYQGFTCPACGTGILDLTGFRLNFAGYSYNATLECRNCQHILTNCESYSPNFWQGQVSREG